MTTSMIQSPKVAFDSVTSLDRLARNRACHAVAASAAAAELGAAHRDHLHPGFPQQCVRMRVAVVPDDDAGGKGHDVVAVIPLLALCFPAVAARFHNPQPLQAERISDDVEQMTVLRTDLDTVVATRTHAIAADLIRNFAERRAQISVAECKDGVEVHGSAAFRHQARDHACRGRVREQLFGHLKYGLPGGALTHTDEYDPPADRHDVAAFDRRA